jgi:hypothetical protein
VDWMRGRVEQFRETAGQQVRGVATFAKPQVNLA